MPFLVSLSGFLACVLLLDELAGSIAFTPAAMRALASARRGREKIQKVRKGTFDRFVELFHGYSITKAVPPAKGKAFLASICNTQESGARL